MLNFVVAASIIEAVCSSGSLILGRGAFAGAERGNTSVGWI